ncbi:HD domain-containing protein [Coprinopsis sp. MPI-PUGE-AT-0042]|nr:HD domain-containing protein [Coprinopsis sp. MPI-PUGE-AT-0042]
MNSSAQSRHTQGPDGSKRTFPPLYKSTGNPARDKLAFIHVLERLKTQKRTGWVNNGVRHLFPLISDHMYRMAMLSMLSTDESLDVSRCIQLSLVHDLAEAQVGDITPHEPFTKEEKHALEKTAMQNFVQEMLHGTPEVGQKIQSLWEEYEKQETSEARFVKDLDRFEMAAQAFEYERSTSIPLQPFFDSSIPKLQHPEVQSWGEALLAERERFHKTRATSQEE